MSDADLEVMRTPRGGFYQKITPQPQEPAMTAYNSSHPTKQERRLEVIQWLQLIGIIIAVAGIFMAIGRRDQTLEDIKIIVNRLVDSDVHMRERMSKIEGQIKYSESKP